jgi:hypothetical protein
MITVVPIRLEPKHGLQCPRCGTFFAEDLRAWRRRYRVGARCGERDGGALCGGVLERRAAGLPEPARRRRE